jgi:hypothetical protein
LKAQPKPILKNNKTQESKIEQEYRNTVELVKNMAAGQLSELTQIVRKKEEVA